MSAKKFHGVNSFSLFEALELLNNFSIEQKNQ